MARPEWGKKRTCRSCGAVFYDLKRKTISCPKCGTAYAPEPPVKGKQTATVAPAPIPAAAPKPKPAPVKTTEAAPSEDEIEPLAEEEDAADEDKPPAAHAGKAKSGKKDDDKEEALIEDPSDLGEDEDDIGEVKEHIDDGVGDKA